MFFKRLKIALANLVFLVLFVCSSQAEELVIEITQGSDSAVPISVVPFKVNSIGAVPEDISKIVMSDLQRSGDFKPLAVEQMLSLPSKAKEVYYRDWKLLGQNYLLVGEVDFSAIDKKYKVRYEVFDVNTQKRLIGEVLSARESSLRDLAHRISDKVYEKLIVFKKEKNNVSMSSSSFLMSSLSVPS